MRPLCNKFNSFSKQIVFIKNVCSTYRSFCSHGNPVLWLSIRNMLLAVDVLQHSCSSCTDSENTLEI